MGEWIGRRWWGRFGGDDKDDRGVRRQSGGAGNESLEQRSSEDGLVGKTALSHWQQEAVSVGRAASNLGRLSRPRRRREPRKCRNGRIGDRRKAVPRGGRSQRETGVLIPLCVVARGSLCAPQEAIASPLA
uniref:Uncharacterized protein n=1 Tax=Plectus sambesii TaxID=2011161 RepID=A0A914ULP0_9BILA